MREEKMKRINEKRAALGAKFVVATRELLDTIVIFPIFYYGKWQKIVTKNGITLLIHNIFKKYELHDELDAILRKINVI